MFPEILDQKRKELVQKLAFLNKFGFYLAGGTALALQMGHRTSVDFDFYSKKKFDADELLFQLKKVGNLEVFMNRENTLGLLTKNGIEMTFFKYPYPLIRQPKKFEKIKVASVEDIAAMKIAAIIQRGTKRDFVDIFYLTKKYSLDHILHWTQEKYPQISLSLSLKGLTYFQDAEEDKKSEERIRIFDRSFNWKEAKKYIEKQVFDFQKRLKK